MFRAILWFRVISILVSGKSLCDWVEVNQTGANPKAIGIRHLQVNCDSKLTVCSHIYLILRGVNGDIYSILYSMYLKDDISSYTCRVSVICEYLKLPSNKFCAVNLGY